MKKTALVFCVMGLAAAVVAQEGQPAGFKTTLSLGMSLTDGNSETLQANGTLLTEGEKAGLGSVRAGIEGNYGESTVDGEEDKTIDNAKLFGNVKKTISPRTFGYLDGVVLYDDVAEVDYRATLSPGLGAYLLKNERTALSVEGGPAYVWERVNEEDDDYMALRFAERLTVQLSETAKVWQSAEYLPKADDFDDYLLAAEVGAEAALNAHLSLRLVLQNKYDSTPGDDLEKNDLSLIAGISVSL
jgi:putative salt-induced outer membrane protein YdiY